MIDATHEELRRLVVECEPMLRAVWTTRREPDDLMVLCDLRREDCEEQCVDQHGRAAVDRVLSATAIKGTRPMMPLLMPSSFIETMRTGPAWAQREAAKELAGFAAMARAGMVVVPLFVVVTGGHWATMWAPPGSAVAVARFEPGVGPEAN